MPDESAMSELELTAPASTDPTPDLEHAPEPNARPNPIHKITTAETRDELRRAIITLSQNSAANQPGTFIHDGLKILTALLAEIESLLPKRGKKRTRKMSTGVHAKREKITPEVLKPCAHCGQPFVISPTHLKFCSRACVGYGSRCADGRSRAGASKCLQPYYTQHDSLLGLKPSLDWLYKEDSNA